MGENISQKPNIYSFFPPEKSSLINSHLLLSKVPFLFPIKYHFSSNHPILSFICSCGHCCYINFFKLQGLEFRLFPLSSSFMLFGKLCFSASPFFYFKPYEISTDPTQVGTWWLVSQSNIIHSKLV